MSTFGSSRWGGRHGNELDSNLVRVMQLGDAAEVTES